MTYKQIKALKYFKPPFKYDAEGQTIYCQSKNGDNMCLQVRGWGNLIGGGAENLPPEEAATIQDDFGEWVVHRLNQSMAKTQREKELEGLIKEASDYLDYNDLTSIKSTSILHKKFKQALKDLEELREEMKPMLYEHYKGGLYEYICPAMLESDCEVHAVYKNVKDGKIWVSPMDEFSEKFKPQPPKGDI